MAEHGAGGHLGGVLGQWASWWGSAPAICPVRPRPARLVRMTQHGPQCAPQSATGQHIQAGIDRLGRQLFAHVARILALEPPGRAVLGQMGLVVLSQPGILEFARPPRLTVRGPAPTPTPLPAANGRGLGPGSRSHVLRCLCVCRISLAWQQRSSSGGEAVYLKVELKGPFHLFALRVQEIAGALFVFKAENGSRHVPLPTVFAPWCDMAQLS